MKQVAKYNTFKGISTALTVGTPIATLFACGDLFIHRSETAISAAGILGIIILMCIFKDKIAEKWKVPSAFVLSAAMFILTLLLEHIVIRYVCLTTMIATGVDELTFKRFYKTIEILLPKEAEAYKHLGFLFTNTDKLMEVAGLEKS